jgi:hypothetical protein
VRSVFLFLLSTTFVSLVIFVFVFFVHHRIRVICAIRVFPFSKLLAVLTFPSQETKFVLLVQFVFEKLNFSVFSAFCVRFLSTVTSSHVSVLGNYIRLIRFIRGS